MLHWYGKPLVAVTATLGAVACGLLGAGTASAGTNGQQINYYSHHSYGQCTTGKNQEGKSISNCTSFAAPAGSNKDEGYWWVGQVNITWYNIDHRSTAHSTCDVPKNYSGDFFNCYEP